MAEDAHDFTAPSIRRRRPIPIIDHRGRHIGDVDHDDLDALLETGEYELHVDLNRRAYLNPKQRRDD